VSPNTASLSGRRPASTGTWRNSCLAQRRDKPTRLLTYLLTYVLTYFLTYLFPHSLTHSLIHALTNSLTHSLTHSLTYILTFLLTYFLTHSLPHSLTHSLTHLLTYLLTYLFIYLHTYLLSYLFPHSLTHSLTHLLTYLLTYFLTHSLTPCSTVLLKKLTGSQLVKIFPAIYGTQIFITAFTIAHHLSLSWASSIQCIPPHFTSWKSILIRQHSTISVLKYFITKSIQVFEIKIMLLRNVTLYFGYIIVGEQPSKDETKYMK
jgi:hypothetical protein